MSPQKTKARRNNGPPPVHPQQHQHQHSLSASNPLQLATDYDTDTFYPSDTGGHAHQQQMQQLSQSATGPPRTTADLNLAVLRSYNPSIASIVSIAPYAVLYVWSSVGDKQTWEKCNMEGTLFVCALDHSGELPGHQRFVAAILNRRALGVFATLLERADDIEVNDEFIILRVHGDLAGVEQPDAAVPGAGTSPTGEGKDAKIYGLWVFSEAGTSTADTRAHMAAVIKECASMAEKTRAAAEEALKLKQTAAAAQQHHREQSASHHATVPGRQLSLGSVFSQQRQQDAGFSVHDHHSLAASQAVPAISEVYRRHPPDFMPPLAPGLAKPMFQSTADTDFFRGASPDRAAVEQRDAPDGGGAGGGNMLEQLFRSAKSNGQ